MDTIERAAPSTVTHPKLDSLSDSQIAAIRAIPPHDQAGSFAIDAKRPAAIFTDDDVYRREQRGVFRRLPVPLTLSRMLPEAGSVFAHDGYGVPVILTRDRDGVARAFLNACQHKGSKIIERCDPHTARLMVCPYHAWSYRLDGRLQAVPREETFLNLDKGTRGLAALPCRESGGIVWVQLDRAAEPDFSLLSAQVATDMEKLGLPDWHVYGRRSFDLKANWKLVLEPFLEGYHVQRLHAASVGDMFADAPTITDRFGPHIRQLSGKIRFMPEMLDQEVKNIHALVTHAYQLFPNTVVVTSPYYISVMIIMPTGVRTSKVDYFMLVPRPADNPKGEALYAKSYDLIQKVFGTEDFRAAEISQIGLDSGALAEVVYGGLERAIPDYYDTLESFL